MLAEQERRRRLAVRRPDDLAMRDRERRQAREAAAADDCQHGTCLDEWRKVAAAARGLGAAARESVAAAHGRFDCRAESRAIVMTLCMDTSGTMPAYRPSPL